MRLWKAVALALIVGGWVLQSNVVAASGDIQLWKEQPASSNTGPSNGTVSIGGVVFEGYVDCNWFGTDQERFIVWRVPDGYSAFDCHCGMNDRELSEKPATFDILVDGDVVKSLKASKNQKPIDVSIPVHGGQSVRVTSARGFVAEPKFTKGAPSTPPDTSRETWFTCPTCGIKYDTKAGLDEHINKRHAAQPAPPQTPAFTLDPSGLDTLAKSLWDQCQAKPKVKSKVEEGRVGVATFKLIGALPTQTPASVGADLCTAMIKSGFELVERAQLDKVLGELKIQDTALVDPETAKRIGKLAGCDLMLLGEITDSDALVVINARLMETETGKSVSAERVQLRKIFSRN